MEKLEVIQALVKAGSDLEAQFRTGATPFLIACENGHFEIVKFLTESGSNTHQCCSNGSNALYLAAEKNREDILLYLLQSGVELDRPRDTGATPLYIAAQEGNKEIVHLLIKANANAKLAIQFAQREDLPEAEWVIRKLKRQETWVQIRLLFIAKMKEQSLLCFLSKVPTEILREIADYVYYDC